MGHMTLIRASHSLTHSDTLDSDIVRRSLVMEMEVGDAGPSRLGYYNTKQLLPGEVGQAPSARDKINIP